MKEVEIGPEKLEVVSGLSLVRSPLPKDSVFFSRPVRFSAGPPRKIK